MCLNEMLMNLVSVCHRIYWQNADENSIVGAPELLFFLASLGFPFFNNNLKCKSFYRLCNIKVIHSFTKYHKVTSTSSSCWEAYVVFFWLSTMGSLMFLYGNPNFDCCNPVIVQNPGLKSLSDYLSREIMLNPPKIWCQMFG